MLHAVRQKTGQILAFFLRSMYYDTITASDSVIVPSRVRYVATAMAARIQNCGRHVACGVLYIRANLCVGNELVYREGLHVYAAAGGTRARMGMHVPTADVT
jgi:hypothetical protein